MKQAKEEMMIEVRKKRQRVWREIVWKYGDITKMSNDELQELLLKR